MKLQEVIQRNTRANQPAASSVPVGTIFFVSDENVLERSNGTSWESYSSSASTIFQVRRALTNDEIKFLSTTTVELVAAPGADRIAVPIMCSFEVNIVSAYGSAPTQDLVWGTDTANLLSSSFSMSFTVTGQKFNFKPANGSFSNKTYATFDPRNKALKLKQSADLAGTTGNVTGVVILQYAVVQTT